MERVSKSGTIPVVIVGTKSGTYLKYDGGIKGGTSFFYCQGRFAKNDVYELQTPP